MEDDELSESRGNYRVISRYVWVNPTLSDEEWECGKDDSANID